MGFETNFKGVMISSELGYKLKLTNNSKILIIVLSFAICDEVRFVF